MYFHYNSNQQIAQAARILTSKTNIVLAMLGNRIDGSVKWYTTSSFVDHTGLWRASINKALQEYLNLGWVEHVTIDNIPVTNGKGFDKHRKRNLWKLSDQEIGVELLYNSSLDNDMLDLGSLALHMKGVDVEASYGFDSVKIAKALQELGSEATLNFLNAFEEHEIYYRDAVERLRGSGISCPKHDKLGKLCDVTFEQIRIDLEKYKILDRRFSPDKSSGAPGYTYRLEFPGVKFNIRSTIDEVDPTLYNPKVEDWQNSEVTASQISTLREGIVVG